jgi:hypothetical protein
LAELFLKKFNFLLFYDRSSNNFTSLQFFIASAND